MSVVLAQANFPNTDSSTRIVHLLVNCMQLSSAKAPRDTLEIEKHMSLALGSGWASLEDSHLNTYAAQPPKEALTRRPD